MKTQNECWLTELKYCREDLVVQDDYYCCLNNLLFTVHYNLSLENVFAELCTATLKWVAVHNSAKTFSRDRLKSSRLISRPGKAGSYKQPLIQKIVHGDFPWGWGSIFLAIVTSSLRIFLQMKNRLKISLLITKLSISQHIPGGPKKSTHLRFSIT